MFSCCATYVINHTNLYVPTPLWYYVIKRTCISGGVEPSDPAALQLARAINDSTNIKFAGVYAYCGHCYDYSRPDEISKAAARVKNKTTAFAKRSETQLINWLPILIKFCIGFIFKTRVRKHWMPYCWSFYDTRLYVCNMWHDWSYRGSSRKLCFQRWSDTLALIT